MNTNTVAQSDYAANAYTENVQQTTKKSAVTNGKTIGDPQSVSYTHLTLPTKA